MTDATARNLTAWLLLPPAFVLAWWACGVQLALGQTTQEPGV